MDELRIVIRQFDRPLCFLHPFRLASGLEERTVLTQDIFMNSKLGLFLANK
jgi:hypothetical protein